MERKTSKVGFRCFLNRNVRQGIIPEDDRLSKYPIYVQVTYQRKNTQFRIELDPVSEIEFDEGIYLKEIAQFKRNIEFAILCESNSDIEIPLAGIGRRVKKYSIHKVHHIYDIVTGMIAKEMEVYYKKDKFTAKGIFLYAAISSEIELNSRQKHSVLLNLEGLLEGVWNILSTEAKGIIKGVSFLKGEMVSAHFTNNSSLFNHNLPSLSTNNISYAKDHNTLCRIGDNQLQKLLIEYLIA